jgi:hypothetical protein
MSEESFKARWLPCSESPLYSVGSLGTSWLPPGLLARLPIPCLSSDLLAHLLLPWLIFSRYLRDATSIPVPQIHAFGQGVWPRAAAEENNLPWFSYLIHDFVPGRPLDISLFTKDMLSQEWKRHFYSQLIDILAQLRQQEFDHAGSLMPDPDGGDKPIVGNSLSAALNDAQLNKQTDAATLPARFSSATNFAMHQHRLLAHELPESDTPEWAARMRAVAVPDLKEIVLRHMDPRWEKGPFVLAHTNLSWDDIIVDEALNIRGIVNWEWAAAVPRQFFLPPPWLAGIRHKEVPCDVHQLEYWKFYGVLTAKAETSQVCRQLAEDWRGDLLSRLDLHVAVALLHPRCFLDIYWNCIFMRAHKRVVGETLNDVFIRTLEEGACNPDMQWLVDWWERNDQYLKENNVYVPDKRKDKGEEARR